jgi:uncharacterized protein YjgD (DUF1641 family)
MNEITVQNQIDELNRKLDLILEEIVLHKQAQESREDLMNDLSIIGKDVFKHSVNQLDKAGVEFDADALSVILIKLIRNLGNINQLLDTFESIHDFIQDATPIAHQMGLDAINKMAEFERNGYIDFIRELGRIAENIMTHFSAQDVRDLADNIVPILETVKRISQPDMLVAVNNAISVFSKMEMNTIEEMTIWKALRELRSQEMKKGLGFMIQFMKNLAADKNINNDINKS